jgi:hypothetical protein
MTVLSTIDNRRVRAKLDVLLPKGLYQRTQRVALVTSRRSAVHGSILGTAFDYAVRFELARANPRAAQGEWCAEVAVDYLRDAVAQYRGMSRDLPDLPNRKMLARAERRVSNARIFFRKHLRRRNLDDAWMARLARHSLRLARLDPIYRAYYFGPGLFARDDDYAVDEVVSMIKGAPILEWAGTKPLLLNPQFGCFSRLIGGADCDLVAGSELVEFKVFHDPCVERWMARQLLVYMFLADWARAAKQPFPQISSIAIYFARHRHLWRLPLDAIRANPAYPRTKAWLFRFICPNASLRRSLQAKMKSR